MRLPDGNYLVSIPKNYPTSPVLTEIYSFRVYERLQTLLPGMTVLDCGASIGVFTLKASRIVGASGRVIAVEPDPESFAALQTNLVANNCLNVNEVNVAAWNNYGSLKLNLLPSPTSRRIIRPEAEVITVTAAPLDSVLDSLGVYSLDFVKIDVEGSAKEVLEGLTNHLSRTKYIAIAAYHTEENVKEIADFLRYNRFNVTVQRRFLFFPYIYARNSTL